MEKRYWLITVTVLMILIGVLRALGGISLLINNDLENTKRPLIASNSGLTVAGIILSLIGIFLAIAGISLWKMYSQKSWKFCWIILILFLLGGSASGFLLYGEAINGQQLNFIVVGIIAFLLYLSKPTLKS